MVRIDINQKWNGDIVKIQSKEVTNKSSYEVGLIVENNAKVLCARKYGYLAASINTQSIEDGTELDNPSKYAKEEPPINHRIETFRKIDKPSREGETLVGTHVDYSPHVEFGTIKMDSQPFLRPALDMAKGKDLEIVKVKIKNVMKKFFLGYLVEHERYLQSRGI
jgi:hypothetical protein